MVFQNYALFPHLSVAENIMFGLRVRDVPRAERDARLKRAAGILGLEQLLDRKPSQLSGGQQQRVALGRAIVAETRVCLMDEPLSNLDAQLRVEMRREIRGLQRRLGMTMLYVTHDQVEAMTMADQVVLLRNGRIEQDAAPATLYEKPATLFAARFVGTPPMNVVPAALIPADAQWARTGAPAGHAFDTLVVGIRPESARIAADGIPATISTIEYLGADTLIETRLADQSFIVRLGGRAPANVATRSASAGSPRPRTGSISHHSVASINKTKHHPREDIMDRRKFLAGTAALAGSTLAKPALAQTTEVSFFYPIAVGGPITRIIDGYAADFEKANPSIKVKPIYSGTYQESITKALTRRDHLRHPGMAPGEGAGRHQPHPLEPSRRLRRTGRWRWLRPAASGRAAADPGSLRGGQRAADDAACGYAPVAHHAADPGWHPDSAPGDRRPCDRDGDHSRLRLGARPPRTGR